VARVAAASRPQSRSQSTRRAHRMAALDRYLTGAAVVSIPLSGLTLRTPPGVPLQACADALCGLDEADGDTLALGVVVGVTGETVHVLAPFPRTARVASLRVGRERRDGTQVAPAPARPVSTRADDGRDGVR